jgi:hypothetical protein
MMPDRRMFYFTTAATIKQLLEVRLKEIKVEKKRKKKRE